MLIVAWLKNDIASTGQQTRAEHEEMFNFHVELRFSL